MEIVKRNRSVGIVGQNSIIDPVDPAVNISSSGIDLKQRQQLVETVGARQLDRITAAAAAGRLIKMAEAITQLDYLASYSILKLCIWLCISLYYIRLLIKALLVALY